MKEKVLKEKKNWSIFEHSSSFIAKNRCLYKCDLGEWCVYGEECQGFFFYLEII